MLLCKWNFRRLKCMRVLEKRPNERRIALAVSNSIVSFFCFKAAIVLILLRANTMIIYICFPCLTHNIFCRADIFFNVLFICYKQDDYLQKLCNSFILLYTCVVDYRRKKYNVMCFILRYFFAAIFFYSEIIQRNVKRILRSVYFIRKTF